MIVRRCFTPTTVFIALALLSGFDGISAERWSRQVSNSDWIPLANPRAAQVPQGNDRSGLQLTSSTHLPNPVESLALPPPLQQQYQDQLIQLQKTQESIQKLLLLQQQLRAQQQLLQSQTFLPSGFGNVDNEKQALPPNSLGNLQTAPELTPELLLQPQQPSSEALPPIYSSQNFQSQRQSQIRQPVQGQVLLQGEDVTLEDPRAYISKQASPRPGGKRLKGQLSSELPQIENVGDEEQEVQLVYVPAETLAQRGQPKRGRGRKQYPVRPHQQQESQSTIEQTSLTPEQEAFARQVLQQIQKEHEEKAQFLKEERVKEFARLNEEQKALERKTRLQQEALQREQELLRQKEAEKKRKELERLEEMARQRELERIREAREKQRQEELERRRLAELRAKEEKRREDEVRQKQAALEQQRVLQSQQDDQLRVNNPSLLQQNGQSQTLAREQARRQQFTDGVRSKKIRGRQRPRVNQYQEPSSNHEVTTTPSPNQPPLSVYMGGLRSKLETVKVTDVLRLLKDAKTIAVLDNVTPDSPQVFVGPSNLDPPYGYAKFDLPYLSSIDHNRVERKVDKLPFFVAPLSFEPPPGYSKIPFPAPHIGSVVVNTLSETSSEPDTTATAQNPNPAPLIQPNSYSDVDHSGSVATTASYESPTTQNFPVESSGQKYESTYSTPPPSGSRFRFRQFYDNKPSSVVSTVYYSEQPGAKTKPKHYYEQEPKLTTHSPSFQDETASSHDPSTKEQDLAAQLALINQELAQQREAQRYTAEQYNSQANLGEGYDVNDVRAPVGPTQYNLPAELPPISPHLPGLVNSLLDKHERNLLTTSTPPPITVTTTATPTTTTTTTARVSSTTYRPRGRARVVPTRARTTQAPKTNTDRSRRPYSRSKSRFSTTTTEDYHESSYEPTKAKTPETTQKYKSTQEHRRPTSRTQKYRTRDRTSSQPAVHEQNRNAQTHQAVPVYENYPTQSDSTQGSSPDAYSPASGPDLRPKETPTADGLRDLSRENYPPTAPTQTENYPPLSELTKVQHGIPSVSDEYSRNQNYPQNRAQAARYQSAAYTDPSGGYLEQLEKAPVNGFNYQVGNEEAPDRTTPQRSSGEYPRYQEKPENANYNLAGTEDPRVVRPSEEHRYSPIYEVNVAQSQPDYNTGEQGPPFRDAAPGKIEGSAIDADPSAPPIFVPLQNSKQEDYELQIPSTQTPLIEITTTSTTTAAPVIIRQRVRGRLGGGSRAHHDSAIQTRPRGNQDEYVRFSAVNHHDSGRASHRNRDGSRTRTRARPQSHSSSQVQTEGNEYIKIHASQQQRMVATTVPPTTTTVATTTVPPLAEEDVDYGFIRPPNFQPQQPDNRFQAPVTYRPPLSEIQHILSNDETAVESHPAHVLKNRPKYHQTPSRRLPVTKTFTTATTSTTTDVAPVVTTMLDDEMYMTKIKPRTEEPRPTKGRARIRRPGKKRPATTTESGPEANELPLDENYPRITPQQLSATAAGQQPLYDDNFDVSPQFVPSQERQAQVYEETVENYPPQEFILNFGDLSGQLPQREEYDQTQLASTSSKKYSYSSSMTDAGAHTAGDIYGSESQWSTKLSKTSFQPSFSANRATEEAKENQRHRGRNGQNDGNAPEIITAGPEVPDVTVVVSSDYQKYMDAAMDMDVFGRKTKEDHTERLNATTAATKSPAASDKDKIRGDQQPLMESWEWTSNKERISAEQTSDDAKVTKKVADPAVNGRKGTRRRRVRVRVRPAVDDFVTAESQHYSSALNSLLQEEYKYNPVRESKFTTVQPIATTVTATTTTTDVQATKKSLLQNFLEEMLKNSEISVPTRVTSATTEALSDWTMSTPMTTPYVTSDSDVVTTPKESETTTVTTPTRNTDNERAEITNEGAASAKNNSKQAPSKLPPKEIKERKEAKSEQQRRTDSREDRIEHSNDLENVEVLTQRYKLPSKYPDDSDVTRNMEDAIAKLTGLPEEIRKLNAVDRKKEHIMTLKRQEEEEEAKEKNVERDETHPKNHRSKWSEVRYPSAFDKAQSKQRDSTTSIPGVITRSKGEGRVKTLSDYVAAIFDSMKSAEEEEEIAKVVENKNKTLAGNSYVFKDTAAVHEALSAKEAERTEGKAVATDAPRDASATQRVKIEEYLAGESGVTEATTTKEITTTNFETTTLTPETTAAGTEVPAEEVTTTEPTTTIAASTGRNEIKTNNTATMLGKVLRTSTTTKVSHMTEICYRGRCVMTKPRLEEDAKKR